MPDFQTTAMMPPMNDLQGRNPPMNAFLQNRFPNGFPGFRNGFPGGGFPNFMEKMQSGQFGNIDEIRSGIQARIAQALAQRPQMNPAVSGPAGNGNPGIVPPMPQPHPMMPQPGNTGIVPPNMAQPANPMNPHNPPKMGFRSSRSTPVGV